jgi:peptidoglycan/LPS O-acetylase OafA/YrhL
VSSPGGAPASRTTTTAGGVARSRFRPELQGLRALAVVLVVVYHVWVGRVSGGVDVFFLITGFLITGGLHRAAARGGVDVLATWRRQFSRLLPAVTVVLVAGVVAGFWLLPENRWMPTVRETVASLLFLQNWELAHNSVDYAARDNAASIVQHFWSLSIQGQFYLLAPLVVAGVAIATRRDGADLHRRLTGTLLAVGAASFAYSVYLTLVNQPLAYFHSATRIWEFALGGLLALWISRIEDRPELTPGTRAVLGWGGVAALVSCGILLQVDRAFPGWAALWPTLAAAMVLVAGAVRAPVRRRPPAVGTGAAHDRRHLVPAVSVALADPDAHAGAHRAGPAGPRAGRRRDRGVVRAGLADPPVRRAADRRARRAPRAADRRGARADRARRGGLLVRAGRRAGVDAGTGGLAVAPGRGGAVPAVRPRLARPGRRRADPVAGAGARRLELPRHPLGTAGPPSTARSSRSAPCPRRTRRPRSGRSPWSATRTPSSTPPRSR